MLLKLDNFAPEWTIILLSSTLTITVILEIKRNDIIQVFIKQRFDRLSGHHQAN
jgi:hypothetical protein